MSLQKNFEFIRSHKRLTYKEMGEAIGCTAGQAKSYELTGITPTVTVLCNLADFAGVSLDLLIRGVIAQKNMNEKKEESFLLKKYKDLDKRLKKVESKVL